MTELTLPERMYLLAYDLDREKLTARSELGLIMRAAALAELMGSGRVTDENGKPHVTDARPCGVPMLDDLLAEIGAAGPRSWQRWIRKQERKASRAWRDHLEKNRQIKVDARMLLPDRVTLRDRRAVKQLQTETRAALRGSTDARTEAALALALAGGLKTVASGADKRKHKDRVRELTEQPIPRALRRAIRTKRSASSSAAASAASG